VGGEAQRAGGSEKYFFSYQGKTFIERLISTLEEVVDEIIIVAKDPQQCKRFSSFEGIKVIYDIRKGIGPIGGLHAGVRKAKGDLLFVVACDMPCVHRDVIELLFSLIDDYDAVIPAWNQKMLEPLHAVYRKEPVRHYLHTHQSLSLKDMIRTLNTRYLDMDVIRQLDPRLDTFTNINKIEDLAEINDPSRKKGK
jgi:molybdopterin-guanine dinucleotide biosynthesis protein A